ncbi:tyrosine-type recombinase/integrase [Rhodococcus sp. T2V]|uniref:tyrosine-type recombinase/integrase n=1 Tax=Rhodococcus sp. T2V TaxID=3034164 RepID=UPI0023E1EDCE|nr:tyrosine-type recombinase/integrase [Rhodococcus sp. T2V]MDF3313627.1 tyrosine-type recombinase/integrase [Rhodococcus sp. T2V]
MVSDSGGVAAGRTAPDNDVLDEFGDWLDRRRGLAPVTVHNYRWNVRQFLDALPAGLPLQSLDAATITVFMIDFCRDRNTNSAKTMARSVRSFLRFVHATGVTTAELWGAVPSSASWRLASLPIPVPPPDVERLLEVAASWRSSALSRRDYAILLLLARLGLRRGEVARLGLDDIDWRAGELTVIGKGNSIERMPLPTEPGEAVVAWLTEGRPRCGTRSVFTTLRPPGRPLSSGAIGHIVRTASRTAGLAPIGAHRLRHSLATNMLRAGASLPEVGQVLRHRSLRSTAIYAKVDDMALRPLAQPWPGTTAETADPDPLVRNMARPWPEGRS